METLTGKNGSGADAKSDSPLHSASIRVKVIISSEKMAGVTHVEHSGTWLSGCEINHALARKFRGKATFG